MNPTIKGITYLTTPIAEKRRTETTPRYGRTAMGYTVRSGAPSSYTIRLEGEKRWRRVMIWQFSNAGTCFVRINGVPHVISDGAL